MLQDDRSSILYVVGVENKCFCKYIGWYLSTIGGIGLNDQWPPGVGNSWRTTNDIQDGWASMINNIDLVRFFDLCHT